MEHAWIRWVDGVVDAVGEGWPPYTACMTRSWRLLATVTPKHSEAPLVTFSPRWQICTPGTPCPLPSMSTLP